MATRIVFVPISIVGCGKSTIFRALCSVFPNFRYVENDSCANKGDFFVQAKDALANPSVEAVLLDRNNHLVNHRKEIVNTLKGKGVLLVALLFVPLAGKVRAVYDTSWDRITKRGDNHPQIRGESDVAKSKMILNSFAKNFVNFNHDSPYDSHFDYVVELSTGANSSRRNIHTIVATYERICKENGLERPMPTAEDLDRAIDDSLHFKVPQKQ